MGWWPCERYVVVFRASTGICAGESKNVNQVFCFKMLKTDYCNVRPFSIIQCLFTHFR